MIACKPTFLATGLLVLVAAAAPAHASGQLKVCADPDYLPYSNQAGQGFENAVAQYVAKQLGANVDYTWADSRGHGGYSEWLARNLDSGHCDVVMSMPYGNQEELTTDPYYVSSYVFVFKKDKGYDLTALNSSDLHKLKIGFEFDMSVEAGLQLRGMVTAARAYDVGGKVGVSSRSVLDDLESGKIDVMITWQPAIGAFLKDYPDLTTVTLPNSRATGSPEMYTFPMSMAVRQGDTALKQRLDRLIKAHDNELKAILRQHGVETHPEPAAGMDGMANL